jgi:hypothetical protein
MLPYQTVKLALSLVVAIFFDGKYGKLSSKQAGSDNKTAKEQSRSRASIQWAVPKFLYFATGKERRQSFPPLFFRWLKGARVYI